MSLTTLAGIIAYLIYDARRRKKGMGRKRISTTAADFRSGQSDTGQSGT